MKKAGFLVISLLLLLASSIASAEVVRCVKHNDPNNNPYIVGVVNEYDENNRIINSRTDECYNDVVVWEQTCDKTGGFKIECKGACVKGVCIDQGTPVGPIEGCKDTDEANDPYIKGYIVYGTQLPISDYCKERWTLFEQTCDGGKTVNCQYGCEDGQCRIEGPKLPLLSGCTDSDKGKNFFLKGSVFDSEYLNRVMTDFCGANIEYDVLYEQTCEGAYKIRCLSGCRDGKCLGSEVGVEKFLGEYVKTPVKKEEAVPTEIEEEEAVTEDEKITQPTEAESVNRTKVILWVLIVVIVAAIVYFATTGKKKE